MPSRPSLSPSLTILPLYNSSEWVDFYMFLSRNRQRGDRGRDKRPPVNGERCTTGIPLYRIPGKLCECVLPDHDTLAVCHSSAIVVYAPIITVISPGLHYHGCTGVSADSAN
ncbi:hypothetical protein CDAR_236391 [Caerostris darwini]|uniref:Uncharacterized protein n=1 Tax=Caerostris darwini TaxID=1538125 RepID=A0AAV4T6G4_9ARAC|nr:hypothetical protein CDAR_236391 [Caerostris darwini]